MNNRYKKVSEATIQRQIREDPDDFELTPDVAREGKPFREALPELAASIDREIARLDHYKQLDTHLQTTAMH